MQAPVQKRYEAMRDGLNASGRPMLFSMCEWGVSSPWLYGQQVWASFRRSVHTSSTCIESLPATLVFYCKLAL